MHWTGIKSSVDLMQHHSKSPTLYRVYSHTQTQKFVACAIQSPNNCFDMYNLILARRKTLLLWGSIEAFLGGLAWQSYRKPLNTNMPQLRNNRRPS
uniref:Uncharacterized protein n=1 Tax=Psilocybe cubensis TaxID=181762 RepID=A0A8H7Y709_PSICU